MKKEKNKSKKSLIGLFLLLAIVAGGIGIRTYAKYVTSLDKTASVTVAKWRFESDNTSKTLSFALGNTYDPTTLVNNRIAPGTSGNFTIQVSNENSEVGVDYEISFLKSDLPAGITLTTDTTGVTVSSTGSGASEKWVVSGTLPAPTGSNATALVKNVEFNWTWTYEDATGAIKDATDTATGEAATGSASTINAVVKGTQVQPVTQ